MSSGKLMAFWNYDSFPYTLHGEVDKFEEKPGVVKVKNYGGSSFRYRHVCPLELGEAVVAELDLLSAEYKRESSAIYNKYHAALAVLLERNGVPLSTNISVFK